MSIEVNPDNHCQYYCSILPPPPQSGSIANSESEHQTETTQRVTCAALSQINSAPDIEKSIDHYSLPKPPPYPFVPNEMRSAFRAFRSYKPDEYSGVPVSSHALPQINPAPDFGLQVLDNPQAPATEDLDTSWALQNDQFLKPPTPRIIEQQQTTSSTYSVTVSRRPNDNLQVSDSFQDLTTEDLDPSCGSELDSFLKPPSSPFVPSEVRSIFRACHNYETEECSGVLVSNHTVPQVGLEQVALITDFSFEGFPNYVFLREIADSTLQEVIFLAIKSESLFDYFAEDNGRNAEQLLKKVRYNEINLPRATRTIELTQGLIVDAINEAKAIIKENVPDSLKLAAQKDLMKAAIKLQLKYQAARNRLALARSKLHLYSYLMKRLQKEGPLKMSDLEQSSADRLKEVESLSLTYGNFAKCFKISEEEQLLRSIYESARNAIEVLSKY